MSDNLITGVDFKRANPKADRAFGIGPYLEADVPAPRFAPWPCEQNTEYRAPDGDCA